MAMTGILAVSFGWWWRGGVENCVVVPLRGLAPQMGTFFKVRCKYTVISIR